MFGQLNIQLDFLKAKMFKERKSSWKYSHLDIWKTNISEKAHVEQNVVPT